MRNVDTITIELTPGELETLEQAVRTAEAVYRDQDDDALSPDAPFPDPDELSEYRKVRLRRLSDMATTMRERLHAHMRSRTP